AGLTLACSMPKSVKYSLDHGLLSGTGRSATSVKNLFRRLLGDRGERAAIRFLKKQGFRILERQHRNVFGEIDIVALDGQHVVFIEVKTRTTDEQGQPFEAV